METATDHDIMGLQTTVPTVDCCQWMELLCRTDAYCSVADEDGAAYDNRGNVLGVHGRTVFLYKHKQIPSAFLRSSDGIACM